MRRLFANRPRHLLALVLPVLLACNEEETTENIIDSPSADDVRSDDSGTDAPSADVSGDTTDAASEATTDADLDALSDVPTDGSEDTDVAETQDVPADDTVDIAELGPNPPPDVIVGAFQIRMVPPVVATESTPAREGYTSVVGKVYDGPTPQTLIWEDATTIDGCTLRTPRVPYCETPCGGSAACVEDDTCQTYPASQSVGLVTVRGVETLAGNTTFTMSPISNNYQPVASIDLPFPAFAPGAAIVLEAAGSATVPPFMLEAAGIGELVLTSDNLTLDSDQPFTLAWEAPTAGTVSRIQVKLDISHHGGTKGKIECEVEDDGELTIAAELVTALMDLGVSGFPTVVIARVNSATAPVNTGYIELGLTSSIETEITIPGLVSCTDSSQCPDGQTCQDDLSCL